MFNFTNQQVALMTILNCGIDDLCVLDDVGYDLGDIINTLIDADVRPTLNNISNEIFHRGTKELATYVKMRIIELEDLLHDGGLEEEGRRELEALRTLNIAEDIGWYCNCLDTSIYFTKNEEIYRKYLQTKIEAVESNMGFCF